MWMDLMSEKGAIVTWARGGSSINAIRSLGRKNIRVVAIDSSRDSPGFHSKYTKKSCLSPCYNEDFNSYAKFLYETCRDENCPVILPMDEASVYVISKFGPKFSKVASKTWVDYEQLEMTQNREKLFNLANELNIPIPRYFVPDGRIRSSNGIDGPWVLKPKLSLVINSNKIVRGSVRYAKDIDELNEIATEMKKKGQDPIVQEYIPGTGYGFFALYNKGSIRACFQHRRLREASYVGGAASLRESVDIPELKNEGLKIPEELKWHGPLMVEFRRDQRDGKFKLMEVNPRFWGSLNLAISSGVDFPFLFYKMAIDGDCDSVLSYRVGVKRKTFNLELIHLISCLRDSPLPGIIVRPSFWKTLLSVLHAGFTVQDDYISRDDLSPFARQILMTGREFQEHLWTRIII